MKNRAPIIILIIVFACFALMAAGCSAIRSGYITEKTYTPGYWSGSFVCTSYDSKTGACTVNVWIPRYVDPTYEFDLQGEDEDGKTQTGFVYVNEPTFNSYEVGDYYEGEK